MINITQQELTVIKNILREHVPQCEARAFGSRVSGTAKDYSDLDLVIIGKNKIERKTMLRLKEAFEESKLRFRVDVLDWQTTSDSFRKVIESQYEVI